MAEELAREYTKQYSQKIEELLAKIAMLEAENVELKKICENLPNKAKIVDAPKQHPTAVPTKVEDPKPPVLPRNQLKVESPTELEEDIDWLESELQGILSGSLTVDRFENPLKEIVHPDGKVTEIIISSYCGQIESFYPGDNRVITFKNGTQKEMLDNGEITVFFQSSFG